MHRLAVAAFAGFAALAGCLGEKIQRCKNGAICASDEACTEVPITPGATLCGLPRLVEECEGTNRANFDPCFFTEGVAKPDGSCQSGVCVECKTVDVSGCVVPGWNPMTTGVTAILTDVAVVGPADAIAIGQDRTVLEYNGFGWASANIAFPDVAAGATITSIWAVDRERWFVTSTDGDLVVYENGATSEIMDIDQPLMAIGGTSDGGAATSIMAVGLLGNAFHYDGATWNPRPVTPPVALHGVWAVDRDTAIAVGNQGAIFRYANGTWSADRAPVTGEPPLRAVWGRSAADIYAVGDRFNLKPNVLHFDGTAWTRLMLYEDFGITGEDLHGVYVAPNGHAFAAGRGGQLLNFDGSAWTRTSVVLQLNGIGGTSHSNVIAVGDNGRIVRFTGEY